MPVEDALRVKDAWVEADVLVSPRSDRSGVEGVDSWRKRIIIKVRSPPLEGKANKEVEDVIRETTGFPCAVISGHTSRQKTVRIDGDPAEIISRLRECCER
jgi:uncharacterized protein (TIGR00251 family)